MPDEPTIITDDSAHEREKMRPSIEESVKPLNDVASGKAEGIPLVIGKCMLCGADAPDNFICEACGKPMREAYEATAGSLDLPSLKISWGGACPVQGDGTVDGLPCYYRARGSWWSFEVFPEGWEIDKHPWPDPIFITEHQEHEWPEAGWLEAAESEKLILRGVEAFRSSQSEEVVGTDG